MVNDLSRISGETDDADLPRQIWYPSFALPTTYLELARRKPSIRFVVARALVMANYKEAWDEMVANGWIEPYQELMGTAKCSHNGHYSQSLENIMAEHSLAEDQLERKYGNEPHTWTEKGMDVHVDVPTVDSVLWMEPAPLYDGFGVDVSEVELYMAAASKPGTDMADTEALDKEWRFWPPRDQAGRGRGSRDWFRFRGRAVPAWVPKGRTRGRGRGRGRDMQSLVDRAVV